MVHFYKLVALLPILFSTSFALPIEHTSSGRSPAALQDDGAIPRLSSRRVYFALPAAERGLLLTRGDVSEETLKWMREAIKIVQNPQADTAALDEAISKGRITLDKLGAEIDKDLQAAQSSRPAGKHTWPKPGDRLNLEGSNHYKNPPSSSYDGVPPP